MATRSPRLTYFGIIACSWIAIFGLTVNNRALRNELHRRDIRDQAFVQQYGKQYEEWAAQMGYPRKINTVEDIIASLEDLIFRVSNPGIGRPENPSTQE
jgi:hypothetical protein